MISPVKCDSDHPMFVFRGTPATYAAMNGLRVICDKCQKLIEHETKPFYHCSPCGYDLCVACQPLQTHACVIPVDHDELDSMGLVFVDRVKWNDRYNRGYCTSQCRSKNISSIHTHWERQLQNRLIPYYCPGGWFRLSMEIKHGSCNFNDSWQILYHGTHPQNVHKIFENGFLAKQCQHNVVAAYFSPSVEYCSHPRYARVVQHNGFFYQFVIEVRIDTNKIKPLKKRETLSVGGTGTIDPNFPQNNDLEYLVEPDAKTDRFVTPRQGVVATGLFVRKLPFDPASLTTSWWWDKWTSLRKLRRGYYCGLDIPTAPNLPTDADE